MSIKELTEIGLISNIVGTIILAFSINAYIGGLLIMLTGHEVTLLSMLNTQRKPVVQFTGTDTHVERGRKTSQKLLIIGLLMVVAGFAFELAAVASAN